MLPAAINGSSFRYRRQRVLEFEPLDIEKFLIDRGHKNLTCLTKSLGIDNCHPRGLERTWIFKISKPARKRTKTTNEK